MDSADFRDFNVSYMDSNDFQNYHMNFNFYIHFFLHIITRPGQSYRARTIFFRNDPENFVNDTIIL